MVDTQVQPWQQQLQAERQTVDETITLIKSMPVPDQAAISFFVQSSQKAAAREKAVEAMRVSITKPQNEALRATNAIFKPVADAYKLLKQVCAAKVAEGQRALEAEAQKKLAEATQHYQAGNVEAATAALIAAPPEPEHRGVSIIREWQFQVVDAAAVPRELCSPDSARITAAVKAGLREAPGLRIFETERTVTRQR